MCGKTFRLTPDEGPMMVIAVHPPTPRVHFPDDPVQLLGEARQCGASAPVVRRPVDEREALRPPEGEATRSQGSSGAEEEAQAGDGVAACGAENPPAPSPKRGDAFWRPSVGGEPPGEKSTSCVTMHRSHGSSVLRRSFPVHGFEKRWQGDGLWGKMRGRRRR
jgi:hypothetical protein